MAWCAQTMVFERVLGVIAAILQPAMDLLESLKAGKPHVLPELSALKTLKSRFPRRSDTTKQGVMANLNQRPSPTSGSSPCHHGHQFELGGSFATSWRDGAMHA